VIVIVVVAVVASSFDGSGDMQKNNPMEHK